MNQAMTGVRYEELGVLAERLARLPPPVTANETLDAARMERGRALARQHRCNVCHNADLSGQANVPREMALCVLTYNLTRVLNIVGVEKIMEAISA
jgi:hypothetical protein